MPPASVTNTATVSGGGRSTRQRHDYRPDDDHANRAELTIAKTHTGFPARGRCDTYTITVSNAGTVPTDGAW